MKIEHLAIWTRNIEALRAFYCTHFGCRAGARYENAAKGFASYFLRFEEGARLEVMQRTAAMHRTFSEPLGLGHFAVSVGSEDRVRTLTDDLRRQGVHVCGEPRRTGDGYFESVVRDPDGNTIEITV